tara:strand:- start:511 stop:747 length:237 start_codon:yes stop_codon:yes gene_type:complete
MFSSSKNKESSIIKSDNEKLIDPFTIWLIRITCLIIIVLFTGILLGLPVLIALGKSQLNSSILDIKEALKTIIESFLV